MTIHQMEQDLSPTNLQRNTTMFRSYIEVKDGTATGIVGFKYIMKLDVDYVMEMNTNFLTIHSTFVNS